MSELDLDAIQGLADAADDGPWTLEPSSLYVHNARGEVVASFDWLAQTPEEWAQLEANARFTAAARTDVPALAAAVRRVRQLAEELKAKAEELLARDPVENGISFGERYEAEMELAVAERVLAAIDGRDVEPERRQGGSS